MREVIAARRLDLDKDSEGYRKLAQGIQRAELEALNRSHERDGGDWSGQPRDKLVSPPTGVRHAPGEKIVELFDRYRRERPAAISDDTWGQNRKIAMLFDEFVGGNAHISTLNRKNIREWKAALFRWPVKAADTRAFKGLSFSKIIEANERVGKAYDADSFVDTLTQRGITPVIPSKTNRKTPRACDFALYCERNLIERFFNKLKHFRAIATRYDKLARNFLAGVQLAAAMILLN